jgi:hypothetical protein
VSEEAVEGMEQREEEGEDVEGHNFDAPESIESIEATEEPPDVEGHSLEAPAAHIDHIDQQD